MSKMVTTILLITHFAFEQVCSYSENDGFEPNVPRPILLTRSKRSYYCDEYHNNSCGCKDSDDCEYDVISGQCVVSERNCPSVSPETCRLHGEHNENHYVVGGQVCRQWSTEDSPCKARATMMAVHFDWNDETTHTSIEGITYQPSSSVPFDGQYESRVNIDEPLLDYPEKDYRLYRYGVWGGEGLKKCVTYNVPTAGNGRYELILHFVYDFLDTYPSATYYFNGIVIFEMFEAHTYLAQGQVMNVRVNFKVLGKADKLQMEGYPVSDITSADKSVKLSFCTFPCGLISWRPRWLQRAFAVIKIDEPSAPCSDGNDNPCLCRHRKECQYNLSTGKCTEKK